METTSTARLSYNVSLKIRYLHSLPLVNHLFAVNRLLVHGA